MNFLDCYFNCKFNYIIWVPGNPFLQTASAYKTKPYLATKDKAGWIILRARIKYMQTWLEKE